MSLNKLQLQSDFVNLLTFSTDTSVLITYTGDYMAGKWADAIDTYSLGAEDELGNALVGGTDKTALLNGLKPAFNQYSASVLTYIGDAISAYWVGATFAYSNVPPDGQSGTGTSNAVSTTSNVFSPDISWKSEVLDGAKSLANAIEAITKAVKTTIHYSKPGGSSASKVLSIQ